MKKYSLLTLFFFFPLIAYSINLTSVDKENNIILNDFQIIDTLPEMVNEANKVKKRSLDHDRKYFNLSLKLAINFGIISLLIPIVTLLNLFNVSGLIISLSLFLWITTSMFAASALGIGLAAHKRIVLDKKLRGLRNWALIINSVNLIALLIAFGLILFS